MPEDPTFRIFEDVKVQGKGVSLARYKEHLTFLGEARERLVKLIQEGFSVEEGPLDVVATDGPIETRPPDYVVRKGDITDFVFLLEESEKLTVEEELWVKITNNLFSKPVTGVILCWPRESWVACAIDLYAMRKYGDSRGPSINLGQENFSDLAACIRDFYSQQFVDWKPTEGLRRGLAPPGAWSSLPEKVEEALLDNFHRMKASRFQIPEKIAAQASLDERDMEAVARNVARILSAREVGTEEIDEFRGLFRRLQARRND